MINTIHYWINAFENGLYDAYNCPHIVRQVSRCILLVPVRAVHYRFSNMQPLLTLQDDGIEPATYDSLVNRLHHSSTRALQ